jgi:predicted phage terminase large subunit-like protein
MPTTTQAALIRSICRESFQDFVREFWPTVISEPLHWSWHMAYLCDQLQGAAELVFANKPKEKDIVINISPGTSKSTIASVMFPPWAWCRMPQARTICGSFTQPLALQLSTLSRDVVQSDQYRLAFPEIQPRPDQWTKSYWRNTEGGGRYACTVGGSVTGMHGHFLIVDDPIDPKGARSKEEINTANHWMTETLPSRKVDKEVAVTFLIMQRLHQNDPTGHLFNRRPGTIRHICLPAELSPHVRPAKLRRKYVDGLMDPVRLTRRALKEAREELGEYGYSGQYRQHPVPLGGGMFQVAKLETGTPPKLDRQGVWERVVRYWDKAGTKAGGAYTVGVLMGKTKGNPPHYWVLNVRRGQWASNEREQHIVQTARADAAALGSRNADLYEIGVEQEPGSSGLESAQGTVSRLPGFLVRRDPPTGDKTARADRFSVQVNDGNVSLAPGMWVVDYVDELRYFPESTYKDQVDASSGAFKLLVHKRRRVGAL